MNDKICSYSEEGSSYTLSGVNSGDRLFYRKKEQFHYKKTYRNCPECKRKILCYAVIEETGFVVKYIIRRHKRKKWWKKKKLTR